MSAINGFSSFDAPVCSLYWQRLVTVMNDFSGKEGLGELLVSDNCILSASEKVDFYKSDNIHCVFCGNIRNFSFLEKEYSTKKNKAELIGSIYNTNGLKGFNLLWGEFCGALWDKNKEKLIIFRDKGGACPLFYSYKNKRFVFSTSVKALLRFPGVYPVINERGIGDMLCMAGKTNPFNTYFEDVLRVPVGCAVIFDGKELVVARYEKTPSPALTAKKEKTEEEFDNLGTVLNSINLINYHPFPIYNFPFHSIKNKALSSYINIKPETKDFSFLIKDNFSKGIDIKNWDRDNSIKIMNNLKLKSADEMKLYNENNKILNRAVQRADMLEGLYALGQFEDININYDMLYTEENKKELYYKDKFLKFLKPVILNELKGERPIYEILDKEKLFTYINETDRAKDLLYLLGIDYFLLKYKIKINILC